MLGGDDAGWQQQQQQQGQHLGHLGAFQGAAACLITATLCSLGAIPDVQTQRCSPPNAYFAAPTIPRSHVRDRAALASVPSVHASLRSLHPRDPVCCMLSPTTGTSLQRSCDADCTAVYQPALAARHRIPQPAPVHQCVSQCSAVADRAVTDAASAAQQAYVSMKRSQPAVTVGCANSPGSALALAWLDQPAPLRLAQIVRHGASSSRRA